MLRKESSLFLYQLQKFIFREAISYVTETEKAKLFLNIFTVGSEPEINFLIFSALDIEYL